jgi:dipeptidyl aminopeptidase/acylaminoacyl peptidase
MFVDTYSTPDQPQVVELRNSDGKLLQTLSKANIDRLAEIQWKEPEEFVAKASDGKTDLYGLIYKPFDFDPNKQYPVIDFIYGGPQVKVVSHSFGGGLWDVLPHAFAQPGFIVITVDARGTPDRGKAFQDVVYGNFGRNEIPDHVAVLKQLAAQRIYMDMDRVGIMGGSWGGYFTVRGMLSAPDVYKVGVATYPVYDLYDHRAGPIEPYMGLPQNNRDGYEYGSSLKLVANLKGKLLLVHGTSDVNATFSATMKMVDALMQADKPYDLIVFPESTHGLTGRARSYWLDAARRYFVEHLQPRS